MSNSTVYLDKIYSKDGNTEIVDTVNRSVKAKTIELGGNIIASHSGVEGAGTVTLQNATLDSGVVFPTTASPIQKILTQAISGANSYSFDDVFSSTYHSYEIVLTSGVWTEVAGALQLRLRTGSGDDSNSVYNYRALTVSGAGAAVAEFFTLTNTSWGLTYNSNTLTDAISLHVFIQNPYLATKTLFYSNSRDNIDQSGGSTNSNTQYTGFTIYANIATNFSGTLHLYGYR